MLLPRSQCPGVTQAVKQKSHFKYMMKYFNELKQTTNLLESLLP